MKQKRRPAVILMLIAGLVTTGVVQAGVTDAAKKAARENRKASRQERKMEKAGSGVSDLSKTAFYQDFGDVAQVSWQRRKGLDEASFEQNGHELTAYYGVESTLLGTSESKTWSDIPEPGKKSIEKYYPGMMPVAVIWYDDNEANDEGLEIYGNFFEGRDNYFVQLKSPGKDLVVKVDPEGNVEYYAKLTE
ncbi:hypothetical protein [Flavihumibacter petaseus]|uniref:Beta-lactamase-inhibitor-like PepSY-like domain-containing protein n=1 Tax=Flavihumibacter petaseus NBRC 106054 TaxID=1220578 RepID=A0A0E9MUG9_9BACT|nr:hypothetical protein [Flavihumibacter petaseus]GAO41066.1 hypothetical protein FPE01S_01_00780 [Flavihumibacter petaseus NBRC 106054]